MNTECDVAIIGGGPGGSTIGSLLRKYGQDLDVVIYEREKFPREHVGESQLPVVSQILNEMGCWDKVEAANFPIKIGATYKWGNTDELWDFEFVLAETFVDEPRPAKFVGQRQGTAFQVDRARYDKILLDHAASTGCTVHEETGIRKIRVKDGRVEALVLADGSEVRAKYYIDASGTSAIMRRALGIHVDQPGNLQNVSFWDYWQNAEWAVEIGVGGTRVQVMSISWGWLWFIPLGPTTTSVGLVCPADYCKKTGKKPIELYRQAISEQPEIAALLQNATCDNNFHTTKDWSYVAEKVVGKNWFIVGEAAGFADPILAAGLTLAHSSGREAAYTIVALEKGELDADWLRESYEELQLKRVRQHIKFADYWYTANGEFSDLKELTRNIAKDAGLDLDAEAAFQWLGSGGFVDHGFGLAGLATFTLLSVKAIIDRFAPKKGELLLMKNNVYKLNLGGAETVQVPVYVDGEIRAIPCYCRGPKAIALTRQNKRIIHTLRVESKIGQIDKVFRQLANRAGVKGRDVEYVSLLEGLEALVRDGFVKASYNKKRPLVDYQFLEQDGNIRTNFDNKKIAPAS